MGEEKTCAAGYPDCGLGDRSHSHGADERWLVCDSRMRPADRTTPVCDLRMGHTDKHRTGRLSW